MRRWLFLALLAAAGPAAPGLGAPPDDVRKPGQQQGKSPADELKAIQLELRQMQMKFSDAYRGAKTDEERQKILKEQRPDPTPFLERSLKLAEAHAESPVAVDALLWTLRTGPATPEGRKAEERLVDGFVAKTPLPDLTAKLQTAIVFSAPKLLEAALGRAQAKLDDAAAPRLLAWVYRMGNFGPNPSSEKAKHLLIEKFINDDVMTDVCQALQVVRADPRNPEQAAELRRKNEEQLQTVLDKSTNKKVQAAACYVLGFLKKQDGDAGKAEAEKLFERVVKEFADANKIFASRARGELNEVRGLLAEGKPALPIEGVDLDGQTFKLADYRGKVVLLDFWGFW